MKRRIPGVTTIKQSKKSKHYQAENKCQKYNFTVPNELNSCEFKNVLCGHECLELDAIKDISLCRPLHWGYYSNIDMGGDIGLMGHKTTCSEYYDQLKAVENENPDKGIAYHGSTYMIFFVNELYRRAYGRPKIQIRLYENETGFPLQSNTSSLIQQQWYENVYPHIIQSHNWKEFWAAIFNNDFFARRVLSTTYPDNISYIKELLLSASISLNTVRSGESAGHFLINAPNQPLNETIPTTIFANLFGQFGENMNLERFTELITACKKLLNARSANDVDEIIKICTETFKIDDFPWFKLKQQPDCLVGQNYDWVLYQILLSPALINQWCYISAPGGRPHPIMYSPNFDLTEFLLNCRSQLEDPDMIQLRIVLGPEFISESDIVPYSPLSLDVEFNKLIERVMDTILDQFFEF